MTLVMWNYTHEHNLASIINYHQVSPCFWLIWFGHLESSTFPNMEGFTKYREVLDFPNWTNQGGSWHWHPPTATPKCSTLCEWLIDRLQNWRKFLLRILSQNSLQQYPEKVAMNEILESIGEISGSGVILGRSSLASKGGINVSSHLG